MYPFINPAEYLVGWDKKNGLDVAADGDSNGAAIYAVMTGLIGLGTTTTVAGATAAAAAAALERDKHMNMNRNMNRNFMA